MPDKRKNPMLLLIWLLEGIVVGFGAILPGISGGALCVAFGMYRPIIEVLSHVRSGLKQHGLMLGFFLFGVFIGFVVLSGLAAWLLEKNTSLVTCVFIGFILGVMPELWRDAGAQGRTGRSILALCVGFAVMVTILTLLKTTLSVSVSPGIAGFFLCGILWGLSFIVPGLSSSSLLLFFGLYQPMLEGIASFDLAVIVPLGIGMALCVLLLSRVVGRTYQKHYSAASHGILGIVAATAVMIIPGWNGSARTLAAYILSIFAGAVLSFCFSKACEKVKKSI